MNSRSTGGGWTRRRRNGAIIGVIVLAVAGALLVRNTGEQFRQHRGPARPAAGGMEGMDMSSGGDVRLTAGQIRSFGIRFGNVEQRMLSAEVRAAGIVRVDETRVTQVAPKFNGFAERLYVDVTGQTVRRGQPMLEVYSPELIVAQEELLLAARLGQNPGAGVPGAPSSSTDLLRSARQRLLLWGIAEQQIDEIVRAGAARRTLTLHAPATGIISEKLVVRGQSFTAGQTLYTIADLSVVWIEAEVREADAASVQVGTQASVELGSLPGRPFTGRVEFIAPVLQSETRTMRARIALPNSTGQLRPGMYASVRLTSPVRSALTVPTSAIVNTGERRIVFVDLGAGRLAPREVEVGRVSGELTEILFGLEPGQRVVTSAQFLLDSESNLGEVMRSMIGQTGNAEMPGMPSTSTNDLDATGADLRGMKMPSTRN